MDQADLKNRVESLRRQLTAQGLPNVNLQMPGLFAEAQASVDTNVITSGVSHWRKSVAPNEENRIERKVLPGGIPAPDPIVKRDPHQRVESLARRLWACVRSGQSWQVEMVLKDMQVEYWSQGRPVTYEALQRLAQEEIRKAEIAEKAKEYKKVTR